MKIDIKRDGETLTVALTGRLDTNTSCQLEKELHDKTDGITCLILDLEGLEYISSSGLRLVLGVYNALKGNMKIINMREEVLQVFEVTGFTAALNMV